MRHVQPSHVAFYLPSEDPEDNSDVHELFESIPLTRFVYETFKVVTDSAETFEIAITQGRGLVNGNLKLCRKTVGGQTVGKP